VIPRLRICAGEATPSLHLGPAVAPEVEWKDGEGRVAVRSALHASGATVDLVGVGRFVILDGSDVVHAWPAADRSDVAVTDGFTRSVLPLILQHRGAQYLHASAVVTPAGVVVLCGRSGTGKSTLAAALERRGCGFWADDAVVFGIPSGSAEFSSVRLPSVLRLDGEAAELARSGPVGAITTPTALPGDLVPLAAIILLERGERDDPRSVPLTSGHALSSVLEHALCFSLHSTSARRRVVQDYVELVASVPVRRLVFRPDRERFRRLVESLFDEIGALKTVPQRGR
jgi:hypothetical protein